MNIGEHWAYRTTAGTWEEVVILALGKERKPPRARVEFLDDRFEGLRDWVLVKRLETPWGEIESQRKNDRDRSRVAEARQASDLEELAYAIVLDRVPNELAEPGSRGETVIRDPEAFALFAGLNLEALLAGAPTWRQGNVLTTPADVSERIMFAVAPMLAAPLLNQLRAVERVARRASVVGYERINIDGDEEHVPAWQAADHFEQHTGPVHALVRNWVGVQDAADFDEKTALREETARLAAKCHQLINELENRKSHLKAEKHRDELLNPPIEWAGHGLTRDQQQEAQQYLYPYRWNLDCRCGQGTPRQSTHRSYECMTLVRNEKYMRVLPSDVTKIWS